MLADLHRHLDGSLRPSTLLELARHLAVELPQDLTDLQFFPGMGLEAALACFGVTLSVLQTPDAVKRVAAEMCEDALADQVTALEIRFAPHLHTGASPAAIVDAAREGIDGRAGLILCGLYGDPPERLEELVELAATRPDVVALDLAGGPTPSQRYAMSDYATAFERAMDLGLGRTVHAGEGRPPAEIRNAIQCLHATRIGHGTTLLDDPDVLELVLERGILIEACPTSNFHTGVIPSVSAHPLPRWLELGVTVCVCTDNT
ncbi:MAG: hypothetical protein KC561_07740, partial [Myxococcales bacterium]|nr:hypothetical protein [Myxococcales bacterium]